MKWEIQTPELVKENHLTQIIALVVSGNQITKQGLKERLLRSDLIAFGILDDLVITTATIKNPAASYSKRVFRQSQTPYSPDDFKKELGYIATHADHEGKGYCQHVLSLLLKAIDSSMFATTRKASMIHILSKHGFTQTGKLYKEDLSLMLKEITHTRP